MKTIILVPILLLLTSGCIQPAAQQVVTIQTPEVTANTTPVIHQPLIAIAKRIDSTTILVTYLGGPDADQLIELETTVISNKGSVTIQSMGSRLDTTPVKRGGRDWIHGPFSEKVHVVITGYFFNGTHQNIHDTWI